jgi:hypothetical protein
MQFGLNAALTAYQATTLHKFFQPENLVLSAGNNKIMIFSSIFFFALSG